MNSNKELAKKVTNLALIATGKGAEMLPFRQLAHQIACDMWAAVGAFIGDVADQIQRVTDESARALWHEILVACHPQLAVAKIHPPFVPQVKAAYQAAGITFP